MSHQASNRANDLRLEGWERSQAVGELVEEIERLRNALNATYACIDDLCTRPGTCMIVRPPPTKERP